MVSLFGPLPEVPPEFKRRLELIYEFWAQLDESGESGAANWEDLVRIRDQVTVALSGRPQNFDLAESLTFKAALLIDGQMNT